MTLPENVRRAIEAQAHELAAAAPPPSKKSVDAVGRLVRQFRIAKKSKASQKKSAA